MDEDSQEYTLEELAERVGVPTRTIRFYIAQGLLPGPGARGRAATYSEDHLARLRLVQLLGVQRVPLAKVRATLEGLTRDELREMVAREDARSHELQAAERSLSPKDYLAALLESARHAREEPADKVLRRLTPAPSQAPSAGLG